MPDISLNAKEFQVKSPEEQNKLRERDSRKEAYRELMYGHAFFADSLSSKYSKVLDEFLGTTQFIGEQDVRKLYEDFVIRGDAYPKIWWQDAIPEKDADGILLNKENVLRGFTGYQKKIKRHLLSSILSVLVNLN